MQILSAPERVSFSLSDLLFGAAQFHRTHLAPLHYPDLCVNKWCGKGTEDELLYARGLVRCPPQRHYARLLPHYFYLT